MKKILARLAAWLNSLAAPYPYPETQTLREDHAEGRYAETAALLESLDKAAALGASSAIVYGRPQHIPEAKAVKLRADWDRIGDAEAITALEDSLRGTF